MALTGKQQRLVEQWYRDRLKTGEEELGRTHNPDFRRKHARTLVSLVMAFETKLIATLEHANTLDGDKVPTTKDSLFAFMDRLHHTHSEAN